MLSSAERERRINKMYASARNAAASGHQPRHTIAALATMDLSIDQRMREVHVAVIV